MSKYKAVHVVPEIFHYQIGGIATVATMLYKNKKSDELFIFVCKDKNKITDLPDDIIVVNLGDFVSVVKTLDYENIIFHNFTVCNLFLQNFKVTKNAWYVVHSNLIKEKEYPSCQLGEGEKEAFINCVQKCKCICISEYEKQLLIQNTGKNKKDIRVIHNGFDFNGSDIKREPIKDTFGYIGRIDERKGLDKLCEAFKTIPSKRLFIAAGGKANYSKSFLKEVVKHQSTNIIPLGFCSGDRKETFFSSIEALIVPSLYEPFGMIVLEAIQKEVPIIATKTGGIVEILGEDYPFYLDINDKSSLEKCIDKLQTLSDEDKKSLVLSLKSIGKDKFSCKNMIKKYRKL